MKWSGWWFARQPARHNLQLPVGALITHRRWDVYWLTEQFALKVCLLCAFCNPIKAQSSAEGWSEQVAKFVDTANWDVMDGLFLCVISELVLMPTAA